MDRTRVGVALLAVIAVLALSAAAASLDSATGGGAGVGGSEGSGVGVGDGEEFDLGAPNATGIGGGFSVPPILFQLALLVLVVLGAVGLVPFYQEYGLRGLVAAVALTGAFVVLVLLFVSSIDLGGGAFRVGGRGGLFGSDAPSLPGGGALGEGSNTAPTVRSPVVFLGLLAAVVVGAVLVVAGASGDSDLRVPDLDGESRSVAVGEAAGRAADRIEGGGGDVTNEVYRAWREMTDHLEVANPGASTPAEFADAAVEAGMDRGDVEELTALFEEVRYGGAAPTEERETRAVAALRRIEEGYA